MVRALLADTKTQTRRIVKPQPPSNTFQVTPYHHPDNRPRFFAWKSGFGGAELHPGWKPMPCPYGQPGDRLWVRESLGYDAEYGHYFAAGDAHAHRTYLCSLFDDEETETGYSYEGLLPERSVPSIHMPRKYSRITLELTGARVERLQQISEADAQAEGIDDIVVSDGCETRWINYEEPDNKGRAFGDARHSFRSLWKSINGADSWAANPWVWVVEFKCLEAAR